MCHFYRSHSSNNMCLLCIRKHSRIFITFLLRVASMGDVSCADPIWMANKGVVNVTPCFFEFVHNFCKVKYTICHSKAQRRWYEPYFLQMQRKLIGFCGNINPFINSSSGGGNVCVIYGIMRFHICRFLFDHVQELIIHLSLPFFSRYELLCMIMINIIPNCVYVRRRRHFLCRR